MKETKTIPAVEARVHFGEIMKRAFQDKTHFIVKKSGIEMVAIISASEYGRLVEGREERFKIIDEMRSKSPDVNLDEAVTDVSAAVKSSRK